jgi:hypothetical protein
MEPRFVSKGREEVAIGMLLGDLTDGRVGQMIIMVVGDDDCINDRDILDLAWGVGIALRAEGIWPTATVKYRIEQHSEPAWELNVVACMSKPGCPKLGCVSTRKEFGLAGSWRCHVGRIRFAFQSSRARALN